MEQITSERAKWVSRTLAAMAFLIGVGVAFGLVKYLFTTSFTLSAGAILFEFVSIVFMVAACSFFLWLAVQLWTTFEPAHIRFLAVIPALLMFFVIGMWINDWSESLLSYFWPDVEIVGPLTGLGTFFGLLAGGVVYLWTKRLLFKLLELTELIKPIQFRGARKQYFGWLSLFFWLAMFSVFELFDELGYLSMTEDYGYGFAFMLISPLVAIIFYKLCIKFFITRPLRRLQSEPTTFSLQAQP